MSRLQQRMAVLQPEVRGTVYSLELSEAELKLLAQFAFCLPYASSPIHDALFPLYMRPGYNRDELSVDREDWPKVFGGMYGTNEASVRCTLARLRTEVAGHERVAEGHRLRIEDLIAQNDVLRVELGKVSDALAKVQAFDPGDESRFQMEAPTAEDDHAEPPRKWKVQYRWTCDGPEWSDFTGAYNVAGYQNLTRSAAYRWMRARDASHPNPQVERRVVPQDTPTGIEPDRGYYTVQVLSDGGVWGPTWTGAKSEGATLVGNRGYTKHLVSAEAARAYLNKNWGTSKGINFRVKWHSNNA